MKTTLRLTIAPVVDFQHLRLVAFRRHFADDDEGPKPAPLVDFDTKLQVKKCMEPPMLVMA